jgi:hypothetical protein
MAARRELSREYIEIILEASEKLVFKCHSDPAGLRRENAEGIPSGKSIHSI